MDRESKEETERCPRPIFGGHRNSKGSGRIISINIQRISAIRRTNEGTGRTREGLRGGTKEGTRKEWDTGIGRVDGTTD